MQVPEARIVTVAPLEPPVVHTLGVADVNTTGLAEAPPVALKVNGESPVNLFESAPKVMAWLRAATAMVITVLSDEEYVASPE